MLGGLVMNKLIISLSAAFALLIVCVVFACEKAIAPEDSEMGETNGNLKVSVFEIEKKPFEGLTRAGKAVSEACTRLNFAIYDMSGARQKQVNQTSDMAGFGTVSFQLEAGTYQVVVVGHSSSGNPTMTDPAKIQFTNSQGYTDTFLCCGDVTIGEETVNLQVSLDRIVSLCRFVVTDDIPSDVVKMRFYYTGGSGAFDANTGLGSVNSKQDVKFDMALGQKQFDLYTFLHDEEGTIHLAVTALDASGNELYMREFDVPMQQNHITWVSGAFFNGSGSSPTTITGVTVNTDWAGETYITF